MKVRGDFAPSNAFTVEDNPQNPAQSVVRFFENPREFSRKDGEIKISGWEYDEYQLIVPRCGETDVLAHFDEWLAEAKANERTPEVVLAENDMTLKILLGEA